MNNISVILRNWTRFLDNYNCRLLWVETLLFLIILGAVPYFFPIACLLFIALTRELKQPQGVLHTMYILSFGWALLGGVISFFLGGLGWATAIFAITILSSVSIHKRGLMQPLCQTKESFNKEVSVSKPWLRFNLN